MRKQFESVSVASYPFKMQQKHWEKNMDRIAFYPESNNYYDPLPVKPGALFWKALVESKIPLKHIKINIPETIGLFEEKFHLCTHSEQGHLVL